MTLVKEAHPKDDLPLLNKVKLHNQGNSLLQMNKQFSNLEKLDKI